MTTCCLFSFSSGLAATCCYHLVLFNLMFGSTEIKVICHNLSEIAEVQVLCRLKFFIELAIDLI